MKAKINEKPYLDKILKEMCKRVKAKFDDINFKQKDWFMKYQWTENEQEEFKQWFINYLKENKEARREIMAHPSANEKSIEKVANWFILDYGWKIGGKNESN